MKEFFFFFFFWTTYEKPCWHAFQACSLVRILSIGDTNMVFKSLHCCYSHSIETTLEGSRNSHNADHGTFCGYHILLLANIYIYRLVVVLLAGDSQYRGERKRITRNRPKLWRLLCESIITIDGLMRGPMSWTSALWRYLCLLHEHHGSALVLWHCRRALTYSQKLIHEGMGCLA